MYQPQQLGPRLKRRLSHYLIHRFHEFKRRLDLLLIHYKENYSTRLFKADLRIFLMLHLQIPNIVVFK